MGGDKDPSEQECEGIIGGLQSVAADFIEKALYEEAINSHGVSDSSNKQTVTDSDRVLALEREIWAVRSALYGEGEDGSEEKGGASGGLQDAIQIAVMEERLKSLEKEREGLQASASDQANGSLAVGVSVGRPSDAEQGAQKKKRKARFEDVDLFEDIGDSGRSRGGSLIETERDRLIRLVGLFLLLILCIVEICWG